MEVDLGKEPAEGEVLLFTTGGGFVVKGTMSDVTRRLAEEDWAHFVLSESGGNVVIRSAQVVAVREGNRSRRGSIGFVHREQEQ